MSDELYEFFEKHPTLESIYYFFVRSKDKIVRLLSPKFKLEKEHKQIGLLPKDRPLKKYAIYNLDLVLAWQIYPQLVQFKRYDRMGIPNEFCNSNYGDKIQEAKDEELWEETLDKMILAFQEILLADTYDDFHLDTEAWVELWQKRTNQIEEGLALFGKYFRSLWD